jgi:hypothetical protein
MEEEGGNRKSSRELELTSEQNGKRGVPWSGAFTKRVVVARMVVEPVSHSARISSGTVKGVCLDDTSEHANSFHQPLD